MIGDNITFVASSKKRKINDSAKITKELSSIISGLECAEEMGLITQHPFKTQEKSTQTGGSGSASIDSGDVSTVDYNLSVIDLQASEPLPPDELLYLDDNHKLPVVVKKTDIDESIGVDSTE